MALMSHLHLILDFLDFLYSCFGYPEQISTDKFSFFINLVAFPTYKTRQIANLSAFYFNFTLSITDKIPYISNFICLIQKFLSKNPQKRAPLHHRLPCYEVKLPFLHLRIIIYNSVQISVWLLSLSFLPPPESDTSLSDASC